MKLPIKAETLSCPVGVRFVISSPPATPPPSLTLVKKLERPSIKFTSSASTLRQETKEQTHRVTAWLCF